jgi:hypothetical protein
MLFLKKCTNLVKSFDRHIGRIYQVLKLVEFVPYFFTKDRGRGDHKISNTVEIGLVRISEIWIISEKVLKPSGLRFEFSILVFEHAYSSSCVYYEYFSFVIVDDSPSVLFAGMHLFMEINSSYQLFINFGFVHYLC